MPVDTRFIALHDATYPRRARELLGSDAPPVIGVVGDPSTLRRIQLAIVCSVSCPGSVIVKTLDAVRDIRDAGIIVAGGFHSPMERECLHFLLRSRQRVVLSPAHGPGYLTLAPEEQQAFDEGRLVVASMFGAEVVHATSEQGCRRNDFVATLAGALLVPHAAMGGKAELAARRALKRGQVVLTFDDAANEPLIADGATPVCQSELLQMVR